MRRTMMLVALLLVLPGARAAGATEPATDDASLMRAMKQSSGMQQNRWRHQKGSMGQAKQERKQTRQRTRQRSHQHAGQQAGLQTRQQTRQRMGNSSQLRMRLRTGRLADKGGLGSQLQKQAQQRSQQQQRRRNRTRARHRQGMGHGGGGAGHGRR